jgi:hypothetical protein
MSSVQIRKVIFHVDKIEILGKKKNRVIELNNIKHAEYVRRTLKNMFLYSFHYIHGHLTIDLKEKIGRQDYFVIRLKYKEFLMLPPIYKEIINSAL